MSWNRLLRALLALLFAIAALTAAAQEGGGDKPRPNKKPPGEQPGNPPQRDLSPEENERLRQALAQAWEDPEVVRTRESVRQATEEYRKALRKAVRDVDPGAVDLMGKLHEKSKSQALEHRIQPKMKPSKGGPEFPPPPPMPPGSPAEMVEWIVNNEPGFRPLEPDQRRALIRLARDIAAKGTLDAELETVRRSTNPKDSNNARMRLRQRLYDVMAEQDPGFRQLRVTLPEPNQRPNRPKDEPRPERPPVEVER